MGGDDNVHHYPSGNTYEGEWSGDKKMRHGKGKLVKTSGEVFDGAWKENKMHGFGKYTWPNATTYEGTFDENKIHGKGVYTYYDGSIYDGEWDHDKKHGWGKQTSPNGDTYDGQWNQGQRHGFGHYLHGTKEYFGPFADNERTDFGVMREGDKFFEVKHKDNKVVGQVKIDEDSFNAAQPKLKAGEGFDSTLKAKLEELDLPAGLEYLEYDYPSGASYAGTWKGTKRHGLGLWQHPKGDKYQGQHEDNKEHGYGVYTYHTGKRYFGQWKNGAMHGFGIYIFKQDERYEGFYEKDKKHGCGLYTFASGLVKHQRWEHGNCISEEDKVAEPEQINSTKTEHTLPLVKEMEKWAPGYLDYADEEAKLKALQEKASKNSGEEEKAAAEAEAAAEAAKAEAEAEQRKKEEEEEAKAKKAQQEAEEAERLAEEKRRKAQEDADQKARDQEGSREEEAKKRLADRLALEEEKKKANEEKLAKERAETEAEKRALLEKSQGVRFDPKAKNTKTYPYAELQRKTSKLDRNTIDHSHREEYLADDEFQSVFKMSKEDFRSKPQWKQDDLKKNKDLY